MAEHRPDFASRRRFLKVGASAAGGLMVGVALPGPVDAAGDEAAGTDTAAANDMPLWVRIDPDESVTLTIANSEMGQGVYTSLAMLIAEELEVDWLKVSAVFAPASPAYNNRMFGMQATGGSTSIRWAFDPLRQIGASARTLLIEAAAADWNVNAGDCVASNGVVRHDASGRSASYGQLAKAAAQRPPPGDITLKSPDQWRLLGSSVKRLDTPMKVDGSARFGIDVQVSGMLIGTAKACPTFGGKLVSVDDTPALAVRGVRHVLPLEDAVIVLADSYWQAKKGLDALAPQWETGAAAGRNDDSYRQELLAALEDSAPVAHQSGDVDAVLASATRVIEAEYEVPHLAHATMEPMNATAHVQGDRVEVWAPTQGPGIIQQVGAGVLQIPAENVSVTSTFLGGGFGRRFEMDFIVQVLLASKLSGAPVKLIWSREEDMRHDFYRPASISRFRVALNDEGYPDAWQHRIACPSIMSRVFPNFVQNDIDPSSVEAAHELPYTIANQRIEYRIQDTSVPVGFWRSVGNSQNTFFVQAFLDELASEAGIDPLEYQLTLLGEHERHRTLLATAAATADWSARSPTRPMGLAIQQSFGSLCAMVVEIDPDVDAGLRIRRISAAIDCGTALNPDTVNAQVESSIVYGLSAAYYGDITIEDGAVVQGNFDSYPVLKLAQMPEVIVDIVNSGEAIGGIGEPALPPLAPALVNAIHYATGKRVRRLPLTRAGFTIAG